MEPHELQEQTEHAHHSGEKGVGLTMAIVAVLLAIATLLSHRSETEEVSSLTKNNDDWQFYASKHDRAYQFALAAEMQALLPNGQEAALKNFKLSVEEECGVPAAKGCTSPLLKKSPVLQQLLAEHQGGAPQKVEKPNEPSEATTGTEKPAEEKHEKSSKESSAKEGAVQIQKTAAERQEETKLIQKKTDRFDGAELFLEISIVLCSISLLAGTRAYWMLSFITTAAGIGMVVWGLLLS